MKGMKILPMMAICLFAVGICIAVLLHKCQERNEADGAAIGLEVEDGNLAKVEDKTENTYQEGEDVYSWVSPPIPKFLKKYYGKADISADTICVIDDKAYYFGYDDRYRNTVIYTMDKMLCEIPTLTYDSVSPSSKTKFVVSTAFKSLTVDFADKKSIAQLKDLMPEFSCVRRFCKDYISKRSRSSYRFEIDFPEKRNKFNDNIRKWLIWRIDDTYNYGLCISPGNGAHNSFRKIKYNAHRYEGNIRDVNSLGEYASYRFTDGMEQEFEDDPMYLPLIFHTLSLRLVCTNGKYFTYQKYTYDYEGGIHGYPTQELISFDPENNEDIDWNYLFAGNDEKILSLFYKTVQKDRHYQEWTNYKTVAEIKEIFERNCDGTVDGNKILPTPGLSNDGVVFSFQPYLLSCFAAGCFHFTIPYKDLAPYMTEKAKKIIK